MTREVLEDFSHAGDVEGLLLRDAGFCDKDLGHFFGGDARHVDRDEAIFECLVDFEVAGVSHIGRADHDDVWGDAEGDAAFCGRERDHAGVVEQAVERAGCFGVDAADFVEEDWEGV